MNQERICLLGPTYPYRGGIAHYTTLLAQQLRQENEVLFISFSQQYPQWLFPGESDRDPSQRPLTTPAEYLLNPLNPLSWWQTWWRIRAWQPSTVIIPWWHPFFALVWGILGRAIKRLGNKPALIFICHNVLPHEETFLARIALRFALAAGDGYVVHAESEAKQLRTLFPQAKVRVNPHPTYAPLGDAKRPFSSLPLPEERPVLLFCGLIRPYKGLDILLQALPLVLQQRPVHLAIVGEFWKNKAEYEKQIETLQLQEHVTIVNEYVANDLLATYILRADVVVLPYRSATQSGIVQMAFGLGTPVITTNVGGLPEVVENGRSGLVVPPEDPFALAEAINNYLANNLRPVFCHYIEQQQARFSWVSLVKTIYSLTHS